MNDKKKNQFVDTNILVYSFDNTSKEKQYKARQLVMDLWENQNGCISIQVLQELYLTVVHKVLHPLLPETAAQIITDLSQWLLHVPNSKDVLEAINIEQRNKISFWDAMIINSAKKMNCSLLWTEDLNHNQIYEGIQAVNPFAD
ncbi:MAG: PIN domain nuclease [Firmicutes bacterium HGW-Firmicutes-13]|nr:MAG: PIN domain nuclease [Firmicutes bacterium HGW-Firmicutes-13]